MITRTGIGFDCHRLAKRRRLVLGGVEIDYDKGLAGHSDADVLCHAIMDALLGAVGDGDIGVHFPNNDAMWKGARSLDLLKKVVKRLNKKGARVVNVDSMIVAEKPKIHSYNKAIRKSIASAIGVNVNCISVKATTAEGMGAIGRGEGMAAMAVATVRVR